MPIDDDDAEPAAPEEPTPEPAPVQQAAAKAPAKKAAAKKAPAKKRAAKKKTGAKKTAAKKQAGPAPKYPRHSVDAALRIPTAIYTQNGGNPATKQEAASYFGYDSVSGNFTVEISSATKYGFLEKTDDGSIGLTQRARSAIAPQNETDRVKALRDAVLAAPDISTVYNFYRGEHLPDEEFFDNALTVRFKLPPDKLGEFKSIFRESLKSAELLDESGERPKLLDVGRDEAHKGPTDRKIAPNVPKAEIADGDSCFVVQPFEAPLGGYYEAVYKKAIEQAGLRAVRADSDIFGTGKIIDQIWRGINDARVLVAELTSKNPNVFYELGLAHALRKPVVLVSSNEGDVPFDLRHIRVVIYDVTDPFWGTKLIDKIADNIRTALSTPEEAVFNLGSTST